MSAIKNIVAERSAANKEARDIPMAPWLAKLMTVYVRAETLLDAEAGENLEGTAPIYDWDRLESAVDDVKGFMVSHQFAVGVQL